MARNPEEQAQALEDGVQKHTAPEKSAPESNGANHASEGGNLMRKTEGEAADAQEQPDNSSATAVSAPHSSHQSNAGFGMSSHLYSSPYVGLADNGGNFVSNCMSPPGSIAQNGGYSAAQVSAAGGHGIGEVDITAVSLCSMGSNAAVSQHLGISQEGATGPYGAMGGQSQYGSMAGSIGGQFGEFHHPGSSSKMAMPGELMGTVTLPIYNMSPYPVPVTSSSQAGGHQQYGNEQGAGAPVGETEWHQNKSGEHQTHYMREGSSANTFGNTLLSQTNWQPLSQENALAMQRQDDSLLAAQTAHQHDEQSPQNADVGRTDSKRGLRGAMAPKHSGFSNAGDTEQWISGGK